MAGLLAASALTFVWQLARSLPNAAGLVGSDYGAFLPWMVAGYFWQRVNGVLSVPEFVPSFCAGIPLAFNPQSVFFSLPQQMLWLLDPVADLLVSAVLVGLAGAGAMYGLLRRGFAAPPAAAGVAAALFLLNGFYASRMIAGHLAFQAFMLTPAVAWALMPAPGRCGVRGVALRAVCAGLLLGYVCCSGGAYILLIMPLAVAYLVLLDAGRGRWRPATPLIAALALVIALGLSAYRLLPSLALTANVPRPDSLFLTDSLPSLLFALCAGLFAPELNSAILHLRQSAWHELDYGVGLVPPLLLACAVATRRAARPTLWACLGLALLLPIPVLVCYDHFGMRSLLLGLPVARTMSITLRFFAAYIPLLCAGSALLLDGLARTERGRLGLAAIAVAVTVAQTIVVDRPDHIDQDYDPRPLAAAFLQAARSGTVPPIDRVGGAPGPTFERNGGFVDGQSDLPCYEPLFGWDNERFPQGSLQPGPILAQHGAALNFKNPVCYVFPGANDCAPGAEFTLAERDQLRRFAAYQTFRYRWPGWEYAAASMSLGTLLFCGLVLLVAPWRRSRSDRASGGRDSGLHR